MMNPDNPNLRTVSREQLEQIQAAVQRACVIVNWATDHGETDDQVDEANAALVELAQARESLAQMLFLSDQELER